MKAVIQPTTTTLLALFVVVVTYQLGASCREYYSLLYAAASFDFSKSTVGSALGKYLISTVPDSLNGYRTEILTVNADNVTPDQVLRLISKKQPVLFKGGVRNPNLQDILDEFGHESQNLVHACDERPYYTLGESMPCQNSTLFEHMRNFQHADPALEPLKATGAFVLCGEKSSKQRTYPLLFEDLGIIAGIQQFLDSRLWPQVTVVHYAKGKMSGAPRFHMHFEHFFSYSIEGNKNWDIFHPDFSPLMYPQWSGSSFVATIAQQQMDLSKVPLISFVQEKGDIFYCPSWYVHQTNFNDKDSDHVSIALNTHTQPGIAGFVFGVVAWLGRTEAFYENIVPVVFGGLHWLFN